MKVLILWCCAMMAAPLLTAQEDVLRPNGRTQTSVGAQSGVASASASSGHSGVFALGLEAGLGVNFFSQTLNESALDSRLVPIYKSANGLGGFINAVIDYSLSPSIGLQGRFGYQSKNVTFSGTYLEDCKDVFGTVAALGGSYLALNSVCRRSKLCSFDEQGSSDVGKLECC